MYDIYFYKPYVVCIHWFVPLYLYLYCIIMHACFYCDYVLCTVTYMEQGSRNFFFLHAVIHRNLSLRGCFMHIVFIYAI